MRPLSERYFYGVLAAAALSCGIVAEGYALAPGQPAIAAILLFPIIGVFLGIVPAILLLCVPLGLAQRKSLFVCMLAGGLAGLIYDASGLVGVWPASLAYDWMSAGGLLGPIYLALPVLAGLAAGALFHRIAARDSRKAH